MLIDHPLIAFDSISLPKIQLQAARLALTYERSHAKHPSLAFLKFIGDLWAELARLLRIGLRGHVALTKLELECAQAGLNYAHIKTSDGPIWKLPDEFATMAAQDLPEHPLIEPSFLSSLLRDQDGSSLSALNALQLLLQPDGLESRWKGVPRHHDETPIPGNSRIAVCLHLYYPELWPTIRNALQSIPEPWDLYISVPSFACTPALAKIAEEHPRVRFLTCQNRGRDVLPFINWLSLGAFDRYDLVCKLHTKRSQHIAHGASWFERILQSLLPGQDTISKLIKEVQEDPRIGIIGPHPELISPGHRLHQGRNQAGVKCLIETFGLPNNTTESPYYAGTMFWFKPNALQGLRTINLNTNDFPLELGQTDGTIAHAIERLIIPLAQQSGHTTSDI